MGGPGSGKRWGFGAKESIDRYRSIDIRRWAREGMLSPGHRGSWEWLRAGVVVASIAVITEKRRVILMYQYRRDGGEWHSVYCPVPIVTTPCALGGTRPWFICPRPGCGRRVAILYSSETYACRKCLGLAYGSSREEPGDRAVRQANRIREELGWPPGIVHGHGPKPKGMHWDTFFRRVDEYDRLVGRFHQSAWEAVSKLIKPLS